MKVGVVGAGLMGAEVALVFALGGFEVVMNDLDVFEALEAKQAMLRKLDAYGERFRPPALLKQRVAAGYVGSRGRQGWLGAKRNQSHGGSQA